MKGNALGKSPYVFQAIMAAVLFGMSSPFSKLLLREIPPMLLAALLYIGAGIGMLCLNTYKTKNQVQKEAALSKEDLPYTVGMILLDIAAPIYLMIGLSMSTASTVSLLSNFEIVATSLIAMIIFKESIGKHVWMSVVLITISCFILSISDFENLSFSIGSLFIIVACICWGFENNCTRMMSLKNPMEIVIIKGFGSGFGSLIIALFTKEFSTNILYIFLALILGFFAYGLSIYFYVKAQSNLGAARTSTYYGFAPFIGVAVSIVLFRETITWNFTIALLLMLTAAYYSAVEKHQHTHIHEKFFHEHRHNHVDGHHNHPHEILITEEHSHVHMHEYIEHTHVHTPDMHHVHSHN